MEHCPYTFQYVLVRAEGDSVNKDVRVTVPAAGVAGAELLRDASRIDKDRRESGSLAYSKPAVLRPSSGGWQAVFTREISDHARRDAAPSRSHRATASRFSGRVGIR